MKNARRSVARLTLAALAIAALSACGGSNDELPARDATSSATDTTQTTGAIATAAPKRDDRALG